MRHKALAGAIAAALTAAAFAPAIASAAPTKSKPPQPAAKPTSTTKKPKGKPTTTTSTVAPTTTTTLPPTTTTTISPFLVTGTVVTNPSHYFLDGHLPSGEEVSVNATLVILQESNGATVNAYRQLVAYPSVGDLYEYNDSQASGHLAWIVENSYPTISLAEFEAASGATFADPAEAIAATQAAILHETQLFSLNEDPLFTAPAVTTAYEYLITSTGNTLRNANLVDAATFNQHLFVVPAAS
jgi:TQXA domain-containing protein